MSPCRTTVLAVCLFATAARAQAQDSYKIEPLKAAPPAGLAAAMKDALASEGVRILDAQGKPFAEIWLRKAIPASAKPSGPKGAILFPVLGEGEFLGAVRFAAEAHDYRDQTIPAGPYTLRYGLQPVNGDHLGVSPNRDFALLLPAAKDTDIAPLAKKPLETRSAESAGSSHPAVLMLIAPPAGAPAIPSVVHDEAKNTWGAVLGLPLAIKGESNATALKVQLIFVGMATM